MGFWAGPSLRIVWLQQMRSQSLTLTVRAYQIQAFVVELESEKGSLIEKAKKKLIVTLSHFAPDYSAVKAMKRMKLKQLKQN